MKSKENDKLEKNYKILISLIYKELPEIKQEKDQKPK